MRRGNLAESRPTPTLRGRLADPVRILPVATSAGAVSRAGCRRYAAPPSVRERWPSGLRHRFAKPAYGKPYRGFESLPLRQQQPLRSRWLRRAALGVREVRLRLRSLPAPPHRLLLTCPESRRRRSRVARWRAAISCERPGRAGFRGEMAEWLKARAWKVREPERVPRVRIPLSPPPRGRCGPARCVALRSAYGKYAFACAPCDQGRIGRGDLPRGARTPEVGGRLRFARLGTRLLRRDRSQDVE